MRSLFHAFVSMWFLLCGTTTQAISYTDDVLIKLSTPGPWRGVDNLIAYDGEIWFSNSNPFSNHNAADIYSFAPSTGETVYERGLFSQSSGEPFVFETLLYWPYEDPRASLALGEYSITDGKDWKNFIFTEGLTLHVHTMHKCGGNLYAGTGGFYGGIQKFYPEGNYWKEIYRHSPPENSYSRITDLIEFKGKCYFALESRLTDGPKLFEWQDKSGNIELSPVGSWPAGGRIQELTVFGGFLYGLFLSNNGREIWKFDGETSEKVELETGNRITTIAGTLTGLFIGLETQDGGQIWQVDSKNRWTLYQNIPDERPIAILGAGKDIYVGTFNEKGQGSFWGPKNPTTLDPGVKPQTDLPTTIANPVDESAITPAFSALEQALQPYQDFNGYRTAIKEVLLPLALTYDPKIGERISEKVLEKLPRGKVTAFNNVVYNNAEIARWLLLNAIALNGHGEIPVQWLYNSWIAEQNNTEKYFDSVLAAIWGAGIIKQNTPETIRALINRLGEPALPDWFKGDVVAALTAITDKRFGHNYEAWIDWWSQIDENSEKPQ